jgi:peptidoglycan-N-acetylglucosamine deacetylase
VISGSNVEASVALTFDDGPGRSTPALLDVLAARGTRATFFLLGGNLERRWDCALRIAREGHVLGNHSYSHARPGALDPRALIEEIEHTDAMLERVARDAGAALRRPIPLRLPYGLSPDDPRLPVLASIGRTHVGWTAHFEDWNDPDPAELAARMRAHIETQRSSGEAAILDLHDASSRDAARDGTVEAVRLLLDDSSLHVFTVPG